MTQTISPYPQEVIDEQRREKFQASRQRNQHLRAKKDRRSGSLQNDGDGRIQVRDRLRPTPSKSASKRNLGSLASVPEASPLVESNNTLDGGDTTSESSPLLERSGGDNQLFPKEGHLSLRRRHTSNSTKRNPSPLRMQSKKSSMTKRSPLRKSPHRKGRGSVVAGNGSGGSVCSMYIQHEQISPSAPPISPETDILSISDIVDDDVTMMSLQASSNANTSSWIGYDDRERKRLEANLEAEARITERLSNVNKQSTALSQSVRRRRRRKNQD